MKKIIIFILLSTVLLSCSDNGGSEEVNFTGDVLLQTQEQINSFGENQYQRIIGELVIRPEFGGDNIIDLSPLNSIKVVDESLVISGCSQLEDIELNIEESGTLFISDMNSRNINFPF